MKIRINLSVYLIALFFTLIACGERTDGLYGTRYSRSELEEMGVNTEHLLKDFMKENELLFFHRHRGDQLLKTSKLFFFEW